MRRAPRYFWMKLENQRSFIRWMAAKLAIRIEDLGTILK